MRFISGRLYSTGHGEIMKIKKYKINWELKCLTPDEKGHILIDTEVIQLAKDIAYYQGSRKEDQEEWEGESLQAFHNGYIIRGADFADLFRKILVDNGGK